MTQNFGNESHGWYLDEFVHWKTRSFSTSFIRKSLPIFENPIPLLTKRPIMCICVFIFVVIFMVFFLHFLLLLTFPFLRFFDFLYIRFSSFYVNLRETLQSKHSKTEKNKKIYTLYIDQRSFQTKMCLFLFLRCKRMKIQNGCWQIMTELYQLQSFVLFCVYFFFLLVLVSLAKHISFVSPLFKNRKMK